MRSFNEIYRIASARKGGASRFEALISKPRRTRELIEVADDRWLSAMARAIFQAGFNWQVVDAMWPGFEEAFEGFQPKWVAAYHGDDLHRLLSDRRIVRNGPKIKAVIENAAFMRSLADEHKSAARFFAGWDSDDFVGLIDLMTKQGSRLGGLTGQRVLRAMGRDGFVLSPSVIDRLIAEGVVSKQPTSRQAMAAVQQAFNTWRRQSGRSLMEISQVLAMSIGDNVSR